MRARPRWDGERFLVEPTLCELLADPLVRMLMASDGVEPRWLRNFLMETADRNAAVPKERQTQDED